MIVIEEKNRIRDSEMPDLTGKLHRRSPEPEEDRCIRLDRDEREHSARTALRPAENFENQIDDGEISDEIVFNGVGEDAEPACYIGGDGLNEVMMSVNRDPRQRNSREAERQMTVCGNPRRSNKSLPVEEYVLSPSTSPVDRTRYSGFNFEELERQSPSIHEPSPITDDHFRVGNSGERVKLAKMQIVQGEVQRIENVINGSDVDSSRSVSSDDSLNGIAIPLGKMGFPRLWLDEEMPAADEEMTPVDAGGRANASRVVPPC